LQPLTRGIQRPTRTQTSRCGNTFPFTTANFRISIAVLKNVPPDAGLQQRANFFTLTVGLAGTGDQTLATQWQAAAITAQPSTIRFHLSMRTTLSRLTLSRFKSFPKISNSCRLNVIAKLSLYYLAAALTNKIVVDRITVSAEYSTE
jgi:hypothetical protein